MTKVSLFVGDIVDAPAEAICTSTNVRLSLMMGTGASVRERGGWDILRECEAILEEQWRKTGQRRVPHGAVYRTTAGKLPFQAVFHCVCSDRNHLTTPALIALCTRRALDSAADSGFRSLALPVFGSGHARLKFDKAVVAIAEVLREVVSTALEEVVVVAYEADRAAVASALLATVLGDRFAGPAEIRREA